jgi:hypothetical protein
MNEHQHEGPARPFCTVPFDQQDILKDLFPKNPRPVDNLIRYGRSSARIRRARIETNQRSNGVIRHSL